ncbi:unnamed protein product [Heterobilharzia americana]|nr:unnamed protein product [Heterobilharzia americana]
MRNKRVPSLAHLGSEDVGEEAEVDLPVACTFTDQAKQRELHQKQINKAIIESRLKTKAIRKAKHNRQKQATHQLEEPANQEIRFLPINEAKKSKKKDSLEEEFDCPGYFRVSDHVHYSEPEDDSSVQNELSNLDVSTSYSPNGSESICGNESDEGYDGSEEQDRSKLKTILFDDTNFSTVKLTKGHSKNRIRQYWIIGHGQK